jgi:hypothetical protein
VPLHVAPPRGPAARLAFGHFKDEIASRTKKSIQRGPPMTIELKLDEGDAEALRQILEMYLRDLSYEIADTKLMEFKAGLRQDQQRVERVLATLRAAGVKGELAG